MAIQDDNTILMKSDLKAYHEAIAPMLGGSFMLSTNVSDYYSEDEKIVGVWTDGKPIYQKTIVTNTGSSGNATYSIASWNIDKIINYNGVIEQIVNEKYYYPNIFYNADSTYHCNIYLDRDNNKVLNIGVGSGYYNYDVYITIQYTKTTDTASTALTTPGAYDINFPNTWPENKEIFFGNGLYGYRVKGNFTATSAGSAFTLNLVANASNFTIVNTGGSAKITNASGNMATRMFGVNWNLSESKPTTAMHIDKGSNNYLRFNTMFITDKATTSNTYDVWVTYTK